MIKRNVTHRKPRFVNVRNARLPLATYGLAIGATNASATVTLTAAQPIALTSNLASFVTSDGGQTVTGAVQTSDTVITLTMSATMSTGDVLNVGPGATINGQGQTNEPEVQTV